MASWREIARVRRDAAEARSIARHLLIAFADTPNLNPWEMTFLESIAAQEDRPDFSTRQSESILRIRDGLEVVREVDGFSVGSLLRACFEARADLSESDEEWIVKRRDEFVNSTFIRRKHVYHLLRIARQLHIIDRDYS